ncbi:peptidoglycan-binding domain-containing protein [Rathayibacter sp. CAU 1779]
MKIGRKTLSLLGGAALVSALVVVPATSASASTKCVDNVYGYGGYSTCIGDIQKILNLYLSINGSYRLKVDNSYGNATRDAVKDFQSAAPNRLSSDGWVGPATWKKLCAQKFGYGNSAFLNSAYAAQKNAGCPS